MFPPPAKAGIQICAHRQDDSPALPSEALAVEQLNAGRRRIAHFHGDLAKPAADVARLRRRRGYGHDRRRPIHMMVSTTYTPVFSTSVS